MSDDGTAARDWLTTLPQGMQDGLAQIAQAVGGMSEAEKSYTTGWLLKLSKDTGAPPAVRAFTQAAFQFLVAAMSEAEDKGRTGHVDRAAKAEELLRQLRHTNPEAVQQRIREARKPD